MRRLFILSTLLVVGCEGVVGPFQQRDPSRVDDPSLTIREQQVRGRDRFALPDSSRNVAPPTGVDSPGVHGR